MPSRLKDLFAFFKRALTAEERDYTTGNLRSAVLLLAIPMALETTMESLFAVVDIFFVARLGSESVAAVGLTEGVLTTLFAFAFGLSMPATAVVARRVGEGDRDGAMQAGAQAVLLATLVGVLFSLLTAPFAGFWLRLMGGDARVVGEAEAYAQITLGSAPIVMLLWTLAAVFRGAGEASRAMRALWWANGLNILLDPCLIFGLGPFPELGLFGAGLATVIGRSVGVLYFIAYLIRGTPNLKLELRHLRFVPPLAAQLMRMSFGTVGQFLVETTSWVFLIRIVALFGSEVVAGYTIAIRIVIFALLPAWGLSNAAATIVGQNLGAHRPDRAEKGVFIAGTYNMLLLGVVTVVFLGFSDPLIGFFTREQAVKEVGVLCLRTISYGFLAYGWGMVMVQALNGAGDTRTPLWINLVSFWAFKLPGAYFLATYFGLGPFGVFLSVSLAYTLSAVLGFAAFSRGRWKIKVV